MIAISALESAPYSCRAVATSIAAYTGSGTGVLTSSAAAALGAQDGVTLSSGDTLFIPEGLANVSAVDAGPWVITNAGSGSADWVLTRPTWWAHGAKIGANGPGPRVDGPSLAQVIRIGPEGNFWAGTDWKTFATPNTVIDTSDPDFYPGRVTQQITLVSGAKTLTNVPMRGQVSGNPTNVFFSRTSTLGSTITATFGYQTSVLTAGYLSPGGSASLVFIAALSTGAVNTADDSQGELTIENW